MARPLDEVTQAGALRVAVYRDNPPFSFRRDGRLVGIDVDLVRRLAETEMRPMGTYHRASRRART